MFRKRGPANSGGGSASLSVPILRRAIRSPLQSKTAWKSLLQGIDRMGIQLGKDGLGVTWQRIHNLLQMKYLQYLSVYADLLWRESTDCGEGTQCVET